MIEVRLTDREKAILDGAEGKVARICMEYLVEAAQIAGAERLVELDGTGDMHTPGNNMSPYHSFTYEDLAVVVDAYCGRRDIRIERVNNLNCRAVFINHRQ